ncbi:MAG: o-succinylbenzoate synthase [Symploca sp. SIO2B6]|nr:o-succinylbenzoate synthase [Symploca sp. SIO2B6]
MYSRPFKVPLHTHHGQWTERTGIILKLSDPDGRVGFGEIAPIPWFGSETLEDAIALCQSRCSTSTPTAFSLHYDDILTIPNTYPACQFGFESALESLSFHAFPHSPLTHNSPTHDSPIHDSPTRYSPIHFCHLLPTGQAALHAWQIPWNQGYRTFKWKIGVAPLAQELDGFTQLIQDLPPTASIRLDANGGLSWEEANQWLQLCDRLSPTSTDSQLNSQHPNVPPPTIECLEQPLPPSQLTKLLVLSQNYCTPIALDESVATFEQLQFCYTQGWRGLFVVKAAIAGSPSRLRQFCQQYNVDMIWSSVLETAIARQFVLHRLVPSVSPSPRPLGFGVDQWFKPSPLDAVDPAQLWDALK